MKEKLISSIIAAVFLHGFPATVNTEFWNNGYQEEEITTAAVEDIPNAPGVSSEILDTSSGNTDLFHAELKITADEAQALAKGEKLIYYNWLSDIGNPTGNWQFIDANDVDVIYCRDVNVNQPLIYTFSNGSWNEEQQTDKYIILTKSSIGSYNEYVENYANIIEKAKKSYDNNDFGVKISLENGIYQILYKNDENNYCWGDGSPVNSAALPDIYLSCHGITQAIQDINSGKPYVLLEKSEPIWIDNTEKDFYEWKNDWLSDVSLYSEIRVVTKSENDNGKFYVNKSDKSILTYARNLGDMNIIPQDNFGGTLTINAENMYYLDIRFQPDTYMSETTETTIENPVMTAITDENTTAVPDEITDSTIDVTIGSTTTTTVTTTKAIKSDNENNNHKLTFIVKMMYGLSAVISLACLLVLIFENKEMNK